MEKSEGPAAGHFQIYKRIKWMKETVLQDNQFINKIVNKFLYGKTMYVGVKL